MVLSSFISLNVSNKVVVWEMRLSSSQNIKSGIMNNNHQRLANKKTIFLEYINSKVESLWKYRNSNEITKARPPPK